MQHYPLTLPMPIWVWYEYASTPARYIQLNLQALHRNAPPSHFRIFYVNRSTIGEHVPDLPAAFWRLPTPVALSDAGRLALLATRGGIYLDADFLVLRSLLPVAELLTRVDVVGYPFSPPHGVAESSARCATTGRLSANFLAARPNASYFRMAWDTFRSLLPRRCSVARQRKIFICCHDARTNQPLGKCRVPHATTDLMLSRVRHRIWPDAAPVPVPVVPVPMPVRVSVPVPTPMPVTANASTAAVRTAAVHCLGGLEDLTTPRLVPTGSGGERLSVSLSSVLDLSTTSLRLCYGKWRLLGRVLGCQDCGEAIVCCRRDGADLVCRNRRANRAEGRAVGFYAPSRLAYHLFDSFQKDAFASRGQIEWSNLTVAPLYRRALGLSAE